MTSDDHAQETDRTILDVLARRGRDDGDRLAYAFGDESISYAVLADRVSRTATQLHEAGLRRGDVCALVLPTGLDVVRMLYAVQALGAMPVVVDAAMSADRAAARLQLAETRVAIAEDHVMAGLRHAAGTGVNVQAIDAFDGVSAAASSWVRPEPADRALLLLTSGTSGESKAGIMPHRGIMASVRSSSQRLAMRREDVIVTWVPMSHSLGLMRFIFGPMYFGCPVHLVKPAAGNLRKWLETITRVRATVTGGPDFGYRVAAEMVDADGLDLGSLRFAMSSGEPVRLSTIQRFEMKFGVPGVVRPGYGLAEANGVCTLGAGESLRVDDAGHLSCGTALDGLELQIVDDAGTPQLPGIAGEIRLRGPQLFDGYLNDPDATAEKIRHGWLHTGDVGVLDDDGHLFVVGRLRTLIKRGGASIAPRELEEAAERVSAVLLAAAVGVPRETGLGAEEIVVVAEVDRDHAGSREQCAALVSDVSAAVAKARGFLPNRVVLVQQGTLPRTATGKIRHDELRRQCAAGELARDARVLFGFGT